jgi:hypothetical protein
MNSYGTDMLAGPRWIISRLRSLSYFKMRHCAAEARPAFPKEFLFIFDTKIFTFSLTVSVSALANVGTID